MAEGVERRFASGSAGFVIEPELGLNVNVKPKIGIHGSGYANRGE